VQGRRGLLARRFQIAIIIVAHPTGLVASVDEASLARPARNPPEPPDRHTPRCALMLAVSPEAEISEDRSSLVSCHLPGMIMYLV